MTGLSVSKYSNSQSEQTLPECDRRSVCLSAVVCVAPCGTHVSETLTVNRVLRVIVHNVRRSDTPESHCQSHEEMQSGKSNQTHCRSGQSKTGQDVHMEESEGEL